MFAQRRVRRRLVTAAPYARSPGNGISRAQSECSLRPAGHDQQSYSAGAAASSSASVPSSPAPSTQLHAQPGHATVASERRRWQMLTWPGAASNHVLRHSRVGDALPAAAGLLHGPPGLVVNSSSSPTSPGSIAATAAKLSHICRFCSCTLSSSSNRHRHERLKHAAELLSAPSTPATGASRKQSSGAAFSSLRSQASTEGAQHGAMEVTGSAEPGESGFGVADQPDSEDDPVQEIGHGAAAHSGSDPTESTSPEIAAVGSDPLGVASEEKELQAEHSTDASSTQLLDHGDLVIRFDQELEAAAQTGTAAAAADSELSDTDMAELEQAVAESEPGLPSRNLNQAESAVDHDQAEPVAAEVLLAEGARPLLQEEDLQAAAYPFMQWLASPCMTATEALVKAKRVKSMSQLMPIKNTLKFIWAVLYESKVVDAIELEALLRLSVCQALYQAIVDRQVGSGRMHQVFLLVKKLLVYISSAESARSRLYVQPTAYESYLFVENVCSESSNQRKQEARNRMVLGITGAKGALIAPKEVFQIPKTWSNVNGGVQPDDSSSRPMTVAAHNGLAAAAASGAVQKAITVTAHGLAIGSNPSAGSGRSDPNQTMSKEELSVVTQASLNYLNHIVELYVQAPNRGPPAHNAEVDTAFMHHLVTATLGLGLAPRSQVLQQLRIGSSFTKEADGRYWIRMLAEQSKNGRPTMFALAAELTPAYDVYLEFVRPHLLARATASDTAPAAAALAADGSQSQHDYVFFKRNGAAPRTDFSSSTCLITQQVLGRPVNAHTFRSSLITTFYSSGANEAEMSSLASIMAHDPATQRNFYYKPKHNEAALQASQRMVEQLLHGGTGASGV